MDSISPLECFTNTSQNYLLCITIHKARGLPAFNIDSYVKVTINKKSKTTKVFQSSENPVFNEYFVFELNSTLPELLHLVVLFEVKRKRGCKDSNLGELFIDLATVWNQPNHCFYKKWGKLESPMGTVTELPNGHLQLDIALISRQEPPAPAVFTNDNYDDIEKNLLIPFPTLPNTQNVTYTITFYKGIFAKKADYVIEACFAGMTAKTIKKKSTTYPIWNQQISFTYFYPSLSQMFLIKIIHGKCVSEFELHFNEIGQPDETPSLGPTFLQFYDLVNPNLYVGRVLTEVKSEKIKSSKETPTRIVVSKFIPEFDDKSWWSEESFYFECLIWQGDVQSCCASKMKIHFKIGEYTSTTVECYLKSFRDPHSKENSKKFKVVNPLLGLKYFEQEKPYKTMFVIGHLPDVRNKYEIDQFLTELSEFMKTQIDNFKLFQLKYPENDILHSKCLSAIILSFQNKIKQNKHRLQYNGFKQLSLWDSNRIKSIKTFFDDTLKLFDELRHSLRHTKVYRQENTEQVQNELIDIVKRIDTYRKLRMQDNWPEVIIIMNVGNKDVGICKLRPEDYIYSQRKECMGSFCGKRRNFLFKSMNCPHSCQNCGCVYGKLDGWFWIGTEAERSDPQMTSIWIRQESIYYTINEHTTFDVKIYIHQAKIRPGSDKTGLCDPKVNVIFMEMLAETAVIQQSLSPIWDNIVSFDNLKLVGTVDMYKENPPLVTVLLFDIDTPKAVDPLGIGFLRLSVRSSDAVVLKEDYTIQVEPLIDYRTDETETSNIGKNKNTDHILSFRNIVRTKIAVQKLKSLSNMFPPPLKWVPINLNGITNAEVLMSGEMIAIDPSVPKTSMPIASTASTPPANNFDNKSPKAIIQSDSANKTDNEQIMVDNLLVAVNKNGQTTQSKPPPNNGLVVLNSDEKFVPMKTQANTVQSPEPTKTTIAETSKGLPLFLTKGLPSAICPIMNKYKVEIIFGGMRYCRRLPMFQLAGRYKIKMMMGDLELRSGPSASRIKNSVNFLDIYAVGVVALPKQLEYWPPIILAHIDCSKKNGKEITLGAALISKTGKYLQKNKNATCNDPLASGETQISIDTIDDNFSTAEKTPLIPKEKKIKINISFQKFYDFFRSIKSKFAEKTQKHLKNSPNRVLTKSEESEYTWWTKFYNALHPDDKSSIVSEKHHLIVYSTELEKQPEYSYLRDWSEPFQLIHGVKLKKTAPPVDEVYSLLKCRIQVRLCDQKPMNLLRSEGGTKFSELKQLTKETPITVRLYLVQGLQFRSHDAKSLSDPYVKIQLGSQKISDRANYIPNQANPIFGKRFQLRCVVPRDHNLIITVYDRDSCCCDDLIGSTSIDLEDRLRSRHRATFGIAQEYSRQGYNMWRDPMTPMEILNDICMKNGLTPPLFDNQKITVGGVSFSDRTVIEKDEELKERLSLTALHRLEEVPAFGYKLVCEHVETRSLYRTDRPSIEQGKIQLWLEIFETENIPPPIDITPMPSQSFELRIIVYNVADCKLDEKNVFGQSMSDIYVKGWLLNNDDSQNTDTHLRSLNGEGAFNWRMIFPLKYSKIENMMVVKKSTFLSDDSELKIPPILHLQIWDDDLLKDDFIGTVEINLSRFQEPSSTRRKCGIDTNSRYINLFNTKIVRGWFPCLGILADNKSGLTGKMEVELQILTDSEAKVKAAGLGRSPPDALPDPVRPETSFNPFLNPLKGIKNIIIPKLKLYCCYCLILISVPLLFLGVLKFFFKIAFPFL